MCCESKETLLPRVWFTHFPFGLPLRLLAGSAAVAPVTVAASSFAGRGRLGRAATLCARCRLAARMPGRASFASPRGRGMQRLFATLSLDPQQIGHTRGLGKLSV